MTTTQQPPTAGKCPFAHGFDAMGDDYFADPAAHFASVRDETPTFFYPHLNAWIITRREDALTVLGDWKKFSSGANSAMIEVPEQYRVADVDVVLTGHPPGDASGHVLEVAVVNGRSIPATATGVPPGRRDGPVGRRADGAEPLTLGPQSIRDRSHELLDLLGPRGSGEVDVGVGPQLPAQEADRPCIGAKLPIDQIEAGRLARPAPRPVRAGAGAWLPGSPR